jgi:cytochrome c556
MQLSSTDGRRARAAKALRDAAAKTGSPQLSILATSVELDAFTKIKKMIDDLIAELKVQQSDEVKHHDWCNDEFQENEMQTMKAENLKEDQQVQIDNLAVAIKTLTEEIAAAKAQIADTQLNLQRAGENRKADNLDFQKTVADQVATQQILAKALDKLATFYDSFVQVGKKAQKKQAPPVAQMDYKPSGGASGVMSMIEKLIFDAKELEAESKKAEGEAQAQYVTLVADSNASVSELQTAVVRKTEEKAQADKALVETQEALAGTMTDLEDLAAYLAGLHKDCDYIVKNFQARQDARAAEIEALQQAKQILSGAQ